MRKIFWIISVLLLVSAIGAPKAQADSFTYTYTSPVHGLSWTTAAIPAVTMQTTIPAADLTATSNTNPLLVGCTITSVVLDFGGAGETETDLSGCGPPRTFDTFDNFALIDFSTPGTYTGTDFLAVGDTLVVTSAIATPEPSPVALMLAAVGFLFVMRKRIGQRLPQFS